MAGLKSFQLECPRDAAVRDIKKLAMEQCNIEPEHMRLIYNSRQLKDGDTLCYKSDAPIQAPCFDFSSLCAQAP